MRALMMKQAKYKSEKGDLWKFYWLNLCKQDGYTI